MNRQNFLQSFPRKKLFIEVGQTCRLRYYDDDSDALEDYPLHIEVKHFNYESGFYTVETIEASPRSYSMHYSNITKYYSIYE